MTSAASVTNSHDKMNKVARGEQATRPSRENLSVSIAPPPSSTNTKVHMCYDIGAFEKRVKMRKSARSLPRITNQCALLNGLRSGMKW
ncbi:unnamed protein product [Ilex paraguariensis]|uniref:Uncharacterized protein n=1 Tax=Ilex paraguariensis TaxID=185542 RepID=A0ABC8TT31_9AQUA